MEYRSERKELKKLSEAEITIGNKIDKAKHLMNEFKGSIAYDRHRPISQQILKSEARTDSNELNTMNSLGKLIVILKGENLMKSLLEVLLIKSNLSGCKWFIRGFETFIFEI